MEQRHHVRVSVGVDTLIYRRGLPIATGRIRDVSSQGVFIETDCSELVRHQRVQCELRISEDHPGALQCVWGSVVRTASGGAALAFDTSETRVADAMIDFLTRSLGTAVGD